MNAVFQIAWREYKQYVFTRGFLLFLLAFPVIAVIAAIGPGLAEGALPVRHFVVIDQTGKYTTQIDRAVLLREQRMVLGEWNNYVRLVATKQALEDDQIPAPFGIVPVSDSQAAAFDRAGGVEAGKAAIKPYLRPIFERRGLPPAPQPREEFKRIPLPEQIRDGDDLSMAVEFLRPYLLEEQPISTVDGQPVTLFAAILIPRGFDNAGADKEEEAVQFWSRNLTDDALYNTISKGLNDARRREKIAAYGLDDKALEDIIETEALMRGFRPDRAEEEAALSMRDRVEMVLPAALTYLQVFIIMGVGNLLLTNTIEERSNKIVEILLSSVTADQLMLGKLIGIGAVGLTMPVAFVFAGVLSGLVLPGGSEVLSAIADILFSTPLFAIYLFYFFCAYAIFAMIFLAVGAVSNSLQDAQSYMGPLTLILFSAFPFVFLLFRDPNGVVATILTWIPIYTPYAVMLRAAADPPLWEILGATALMLVFGVVLGGLMGRIFRGAILQGAPLKLKDIMKLLAQRER